MKTMTTFTIATGVLASLCLFAAWQTSSSQEKADKPKPETWQKQFPAVTFVWQGDNIEQIISQMESRGWHKVKLINHKSDSNLTCVVYDYGSGVTLNLVQIYQKQEEIWVLRSVVDVKGKAVVKEKPETGFSIYKENKEIAIYQSD